MYFFIPGNCLLPRQLQVNNKYVSVNRSQKENVVPTIDETEKTAIDGTESNESNRSGFGEPMEVDDCKDFYIFHFVLDETLF